VYAPICSKKGVAFFGRDSESTLPVWSAKDGFPGDKVYREFHKDLGWELPISKLQKKGISTKRPLGLKFHKITDDKAPLGEKAFYLENEAKKKVAEHADSYLLARSKQLEKLTLSSSFKPLLVAPFDAELFGHWWYEGPFFIENILKNSTKYSIKLTNLKEFLLQKPNLQICDPSPSSWGQGGYHNYWINDANAWIVPEITKAGSTFVDLCSKNFKNELSPRLFKQAARELLLSESSDWSFILRAGTTTELAKERIERHLFRFWKIVEMIKNHSNINLKFLEDIEEEDKVFPDINIDDWRK
jgi:1,4-alpha-glucan branching enzyme